MLVFVVILLGKIGEEPQGHIKSPLYSGAF